MAQVLEGLAAQVEQLTNRMRQLEIRIAVLEGVSAEVIPPSPLAQRAENVERPPETWKGFPPAELPTGAVPALGKAVLGFAGAYLLRAISELGTIPKLPVLLIAILYAMFWMVLAARAKGGAAHVIYGTTSAMILCPLIWESTARFGTIPVSFAAVALSAFLSLTLGLSLWHDLDAVPWVVVIFVEATTIGLIVVTHELVPLTMALLFYALATEVCACTQHVQMFRGVPAFAVNVGMWVFVDVMASPNGPPQAYRSAPVGTVVVIALSLVVVYAMAIAVRGFVMRKNITVFEMVQIVPAAALSGYGVLRATNGSAAMWLGAVVLMLSAACYWGTLWRFADERLMRNRRVTAYWAAALFVSAVLLLVPAASGVAVLSVAALAAAYVYTRTQKLSLGIHASVFLVAALCISAMPMYAAGALVAIVPGRTPAGVWLLTVASIACYVLGGRAAETAGKRRLLWVCPALLSAFAVAALVVVAVAEVISGLSAPWLSVVRTVVTCAVAFGAGIAGAKLRRIEWTWVAYGFVSVGAVKLLVEDFRYGNAMSLVVSLLAYGAVLIVVPRMEKGFNARD